MPISLSEIIMTKTRGESKKQRNDAS